MKYMQGRIDLHMHSTVSDGSDGPAELLQRVRESDICLFALTDHDAIKGCREIWEMIEPSDPAFITGTEFSCRDEFGKYHILGYAYDMESEAICSLVNRGHSNRMKKVMARLDFIRDEFGFSFPEEEIKTLLARDNPGKPHIGNLMVKYGYARSKEQAIHEYIDKMHVKMEYFRPEYAIRGILDAGGVPVLAHPSFGDGEQMIIGREMEERLRRLMSIGLQGVEAYYSGFSPKLQNEMLELAKRYGLYVTAGSDYHGSNKLIELGDTGQDPASPRPDGMIRFLERVSASARPRAVNNT